MEGINNKNFVDHLFKESINVMAGDEWSWPSHWDRSRQLQFLSNSLDYAVENEFWEQAAIIRDVKKEFESPESL